jgi:hypothetical protein
LIWYNGLDKDGNSSSILWNSNLKRYGNRVLTTISVQFNAGRFIPFLKPSKIS